MTRDKRLVSVPAPSKARDLQAVSDVVADTGVALDELALRSPTLDDAFLALTGQPLQPAQVDAESDEPTEVPA